LLLAWRHNIAQQYIKDIKKANEKSSIKTIYYLLVQLQDKCFHRLIRKFFTDRICYRQTLLHSEDFYTQTLSHTKAFTLHTEAFTPRSFAHNCVSTLMLLHTNIFTHRRIYTQNIYTYNLLHRETFVQNRFHTIFF
jgi:hypothetical protein